MTVSSKLFGLHADALQLRQTRLQLIASNLANADTAQYKAQDIDFTGALQSAAASSAKPGGAADVTRPSEASFRYLRTPLQPSLDGNTVDAEIENAAFAQAALEYRVSLNFIEQRVRGLLLAITGQ